MAGLVPNAAAQKSPSASPLFTNRFFTGEWTQRSLMRDPSTAAEVYYGGTRVDSLFDGVNIELTNNLTLRRAPGTFPYSTVSFGEAVNSFYSFRQFTTNSETISLMVDTPSSVFVVTPSASTNIFTKSTGAGNTRFLGVGNILYMGDGIDQKAYQPSDPRFANSVRNWGIAQNGGSQLGYPGLATDAGAGGASGTQSFPNNGFANTNRGGVNWLDQNTGTPTGNLPASAPLAGAPTPFSNFWFTSNLGFSVPAGATINGIIVSVNRCSVDDGSGTGLINDDTVYLLKALTQEGTNQSTGLQWPDSLTPGPQTQNFGGTTSTWGGAFTDADINASGFGFQISVTGGNAAAIINSVSVTVYYTVVALGYAWANPANAQGPPDGAFAIASVSSSPSVSVPTNTLQLTGYGFSIPSGSAILGIKVDITDKYIVGTGGQGTVQASIFANGGTSGSPKTFITASSVSETRTLGADNDTWLTTLSSNQVNDGGFGVQIIGSLAAGSNQNGALGIDAVAITISYLEAPTVALNGAGTLDATTGYVYVYCYVNTASGAASVATPRSANTGPFINNSVDITVVASTDPQVNEIWVFRTEDGGSTFFRLPNTYPNANAIINDNSPDADLILNITPDLIGLNTVPPIGATAPEFHQGRIWVAVGNTVRFSSGPDLGDTTVGNGNEGFPPLNFFTFPSLVTRLVSITQGLLVFTVSDIYIIYGNGSATAVIAGAANVTVFNPSSFVKGVGLLSYTALDINGTTIYIMANDNQVLALDPSSGISEIGFPIGAPPSGYNVGEVPTLADYDSAQAYLAWHVRGSANKAIYLADGSTGWFRCNTSQAPDGGFVWSPKRNVTGGCKAVQSIETSPGIHQLLIGPDSGGGNILARNEAQEATITATSLTSNVATFTAKNSFVLGQRVNVAGIASNLTYLVTNAIITSVTSTSFTIVITHADISAHSEAGLYASLAYTDNGVTYPSNFKMGGLVLAKPGQLAQVVFLTADFIRTGTSPILSILLNEIKGDFENLSQYVHGDPPALYGATGNATSLFSNRYEALQTVEDNENETPNAAYCRHMQVQVDFGADDVVGNEILTLTVFGALFGESD